MRGFGTETAVYVYETDCFSPWDVVEFLFSAGINSSSIVACVIQEIRSRFLLALGVLGTRHRSLEAEDLSGDDSSFDKLDEEIYKW